MTSMLSKRLGKRSLLGARVCAPSCLGDRVLTTGHVTAWQPEVDRMVYPVSIEGSHWKELQEENARTFPSLNRFKLYPGQKVYITHNGCECCGLVEQHNHVDDEVTVFLPAQGLRARRKMEDVRLLEMPLSTAPEYSTPGPSEAAPRSVSCSIEVPKKFTSQHLKRWMLRAQNHNVVGYVGGAVGYRFNRLPNFQPEGINRRSDAVEMDEMMAAMVLTTLSCSPLVQSPPCIENIKAPQAVCDSWKESGDVSDSGSSTASGHWSGDSGISTPSPPYTQLSPKYSEEAFGSPRADEGFDTDPDPFLVYEPTPRKRKNSVKVTYKCLWPSCGKLLRSIVGIKRHVKTQHLGDGSDSNQHKREEDFYYTEVQVKEELEAEPCKSPSIMTAAPASVIQQAPARPKALPSIQIPVSPHIFTSISWAAAAPAALPPALSPIRSRSLSLSEQQPAAVKSQPTVTSPPRAHSGTRKVRGEAKKCRKVYGIEHRDQWCTACRWKKACQRFLD
ncbi:zinc finger protein 395 isoform X2 [Microcaecilia unicolor]|uniref:Zinc finger protein 395 isoform X2 n=1 Tax=Microcaecilia unicolor TaxID=1415580 RepID=A0A6P7XV60_9AMPH|nr:zinc finger protein 395 isoform X2 [Microcaecilia unicolor]